GDQQDRADGEEDVLPEEEADVVRTGREGADPLPGPLGERAVAALGGALRHGDGERADGLGVPEDVGQPDGGADLPQAQVEREEAPGGEPAEPGDQGAG